MMAVGSGITVSGELVDYPVFTAQAIRYGLAALILIVGTKMAGRRIPRPRGREWLWLGALAATGLALFNVALVKAVDHAEPAAIAVIVSAVPLLLIMADAIRKGRAPSTGTVVGVMLVVVGAVIVQGGGRTNFDGIVWSLVALGGEAAFTLLAVPVLGSLGPFGVSTHTCWIATLQLAAIALILDGTNAVPELKAGEVFAIGYLAVVLTAIAFVLWYTAVEQLGSGTAGLFAGLLPVSAAATGLIPGLTTITPAVLGGSVVVGAGIVLGLAADRPSGSRLDAGSVSSAPSPSLEVK